MPSFSAVKDMAVVLPRLKEWMKASGKSMRAICMETQVLERPERMAHANLSPILNGRPGENLYLQQAMVLTKIIGVPFAALFLDTNDPRVASDAVKVAKAFVKLPEARRAHLLEALTAETAKK